MVDSSVVDTNVLIVASAAHDGSPFQPDATPIQEAAMRDKVLKWLEAFELDPERCVVLDCGWHICNEYQNKLNLEQDYGWLAIMSKKDRNEVVWVGIDVDANDHAILPTALSRAVSDLEDRKMVAAVLSAQAAGNECRLINACDTDWLDCKQALEAADVHVHHLLEDWLKHRHESKKRRGK